MSTSSDLDRKLLDRALDQQAKDGQAFFRDLKIAALVLLVFQFGIFFRYVDLSDQLAGIQQKQGQLREEQQAVDEAQQAFARLESVLQSGAKKMGEELSTARERLRARLGLLNQTLEFARIPPPGQPPGPSNMRNVPNSRATPNAPAEGEMLSFNLSGMNPAQVPPGVSNSNMAMQAPITGSVLSSTSANGIRVEPVDVFGGLTPEEQKVLREGKPADAYDRILGSVVEVRLITPLFDALNADGERWIRQPFAEAQGKFRQTLESHRALLRDRNFPVEQDNAVLTEVSAMLAKIRFQPPATNKAWWRSFAVKGAVFDDLRLQTETVVSEVGMRLSGPELDLSHLRTKLNKLGEDAGKVQEKLQADVSSLDKEYGEVQSLVASVAKPLATVALSTREVVCYNPVILACAFAFFAVRYLRLARRVQVLSELCRSLGYAEETIRVYFADDPGVAFTRWSERLAGKLPWRNVPGVTLCALPGLVAIVSAQRVLASPSLRADAPKALYAVAICGFVVAFFFLIAAPFFPDRWRTRLGLDRGGF
ncbi:MAG: hypothetical protein U0794_06860 [Isosphaeraceae bacterium]